MTRCALWILFFTTVASASPQITFVAEGFADLITSRPTPLLFKAGTISSSPDATVTLGFSNPWVAFQKNSSSSSCASTNVQPSLTISANSKPVSVYACLLYYPGNSLGDPPKQGVNLFTFLTATARGFPSATVPVPINLYPIGKVGISPSTISFPNPPTVKVTKSPTFPLYPTKDPTYHGGATGWLSEDDSCQKADINAKTCTVTVTLKANASGLTPGGQYSADIYFIDPTGDQATLSVNYTYAPTSVTSGALNFVPITPCRVVDTRNSDGPKMKGDSTRSFVIPGKANCGIPTTAQAYTFNVTVVPTSHLDWLTLWPAGQDKPQASTLNSYDGRIKANAAIVPAGLNGAISVYAHDETDVILDISGYFVAVTDNNPAALAFYPLKKLCRVADTRVDSYGKNILGPPSLPSGGSRDFPILLGTCGIPSTAKAYSLNFTVAPAGPVQYITAWPTGKERPKNASTLNAPRGGATANAAIVPAGDLGDVSVYTTDATDLIIDVSGYFAPSGAGGLSLYNLVPCRVYETRVTSNSPPITGEPDVNVGASPCGVPSVAQAYVLNATVMPPGPLTFLRLWPQGQEQPDSSTLNSDGSVTSNMTIVPTTNGSISAHVTDPTHLFLDIFGYFAP